MEDAATLTAPYGVYLLSTLAIARGSHTRLGVVLVTLLGQDHLTVLAMRYINEELLEMEMKLEV